MKQTRHRHSSGLCHKNDKQIRFYFDHKPYYGVAGDTIESALLANDVFCFGYSRTYMLPAGSNSHDIYKGVVEVELKNKHVFSAPASDIAICEHMNIFSTNSRNIFSQLKSFSLRGFFSDTVNGYKNHYSENRQSFLNYSVGKALSPLVEASTEKQLHHPDIHIIGGGASGLYAAMICVMSGLRVLITEKKPEIYFPKTNSDIYSRMSQALLETVSQHPLITILKNTTILPIEKNDAYVTAVEAPKAFNPDQANAYHTNIHVIKSKQTFIATGIKEQGFICSGSHMGGIFTPETYNDQHHLYGLNIEKNIVLYVNNDKAYDILKSADIGPEKINAIIDERSTISPTMQTAMDRGYSLYTNSAITQLQGKDRIETLTFQTKDHDKLNSNPKNIECEILIHSAGHVLDLNLYRSDLSAIKTESQQDNQIIMVPKDDVLSKKFTVIGYGTGEKNYSALLKETYNRVKAALEADNIKVDFPETTSEHLNKDNHFSAATFNNSVDRKLADKTYFPYDVRFSDLRDAILKDQPIPDMLDYFSDIEVLGQDQNSVFHIISEIAHEYGFTDNKKYALFLKTYQESYLGSQSAVFTAYARDVSLIGHIYPALYSAYRALDLEISTEKREIAPQTLYADGDKEALTQIYNEIKNNYAIRDLSFVAGPFILTGPDSALLLEKSFNISMLDLAVGKSRDITITLPNRKDVALTISHAQKDNFFLTTSECSHYALRKYLEGRLCSNESLKYALSDQSEQMSMLHIFGKNAHKALSFFNMKLDDIPAKDDVFLSLWYRNIEIYLHQKQEYGLPSLILFMPSDAAAHIFPYLFDIDAEIKNQLFDEKMIQLFALETGQTIENIAPDLLKKYPYMMCAVPLAAQEVIKKDMAIFENKSDARPVGIVTEAFYSPLLKKYLASIRLCIKPDRLEGKTIFAHHKQDNSACHIKILSAENITQKEAVYE